MINDEKNDFIEYEAYQSILNIELFNDIVTFIMFTTNEDKNSLLNFLENNHIWFKRKINNNIPFKYLGELLERYKDKFGTDIKNTRAIALALAYSKPLVTQQMIVGTQEINFINDIEKLAKDDIYLKAALYVYDNKKYYNYLQELKERKYNKTEEIIFVLSIYKDFNEGFNIYKDQMIELLGKSKTISVFNNVGIYNWLIRNLYPIVNKNRKKDLELLRALITIPTALIKEENKIHCVLRKNSYSKEEIAYLNYTVLNYRPVPNTVRMGKSIVEEKIALNMCEVLINSEESYSKNIYNYIKKIIELYRNFDIKCYGYERIKDALKDLLKIKNPTTFIEFYEIFNREIFLFDILDDKWDIIANKFDEIDYRDLFDNYLLFNNFNKQKMEKCIEKYKELTQKEYLNSFEQYHYNRNSIFSKLVEVEIIDLKEYFIEYKRKKENEEVENIDLEHLKDYVSKIQNRKSFLFLKYFLQEHTILETDDLGFDLNWLYNIHNGSYYSRENINIKRNFLNLEETKQLFRWLNEYVFRTKAESYIEFVVLVLKDEYLSTIMSKEEMRKVYFSIIKLDPNIWENRYLRQKYLTEQELKKQEDKEKEEQRRQELLKKQQIENEFKQQFKDISKSSFKDIYDFYDYNSWNNEIQSIKANIVKMYLDKYLKKHKLIKKEIIYFNQICNKLLNQDVITLQVYKNYILNYINEGGNELCKKY